MIVNHQLQKETEAEKKAMRSDKKYIIICDRSAIEPAAYIGIKDYNNIISKYDWNFEEIRDSYDLVLHLTTIAKDATELYSRDNNKARKENIITAIDLDNRILSIWNEHKNRCIINNCIKDFNLKLESAKYIVIQFLYSKMNK